MDILCELLSSSKETDKKYSDSQERYDHSNAGIAISPESLSEHYLQQKLEQIAAQYPKLRLNPIPQLPNQIQGYWFRSTSKGIWVSRMSSRDPSKLQTVTQYDALCQLEDFYVIFEVKCGRNYWTALRPKEIRKKTKPLSMFGREIGYVVALPEAKIERKKFPQKNFLKSGGRIIPLPRFEKLLVATRSPYP